MRKEIWRFVFLYVLLITAFVLLIGLEPVQRIVDLNGLYTGFIIRLSALLLKPLGIITGTEGSIIYLRNGALRVLFGCNGLEAFLIYSAAVLAFRASHRQKLLGILVGFWVLQFFNVLRIAMLSLMYVHFKQYFYLFHVYVAQGFMIALSFLLFLGYLHHVSRQN